MGFFSRDISSELSKRVQLPGGFTTGARVRMLGSGSQRNGLQIQVGDSGTVLGPVKGEEGFVQVQFDAGTQGPPSGKRVGAPTGHTSVWTRTGTNSPQACRMGYA